MSWSIDVECHTQLGHRPTEPGVDGFDWNAECVRDLVERHPDVVMEDDHGALIDRQVIERPLELLAVVDGPQLIGRDWLTLIREIRDLWSHTSLAVARSNQGLVCPRLEPRRITQLRKEDLQPDSTHVRKVLPEATSS